MLANTEVINLLKWSRQSVKDPLFQVAQRWMVNEEPERALILESLQRISELVHSEKFKYQKFEIMQLRHMLLARLNESEKFDLDLVEDSLADRPFDRKDYICLSMCLIMCLSVGFFQIL